ncbi:GNAT family N-acetyltransferase [Pseudoxanthomonas sacheonensis]|uniref:RimJ/RimL family protein N-acetyltransferase n=1 Tax=Pseudoxanthomonas sacheonensis TaxID=443615 RepID=A0ABU1RRR3_9GAMM|nr:GNAT family protein [Pseudoxanthomonas sacheonensis]MDR6841463.1 RimJ/RimL family protein N-acetyltransferase [Pseudoxanthomonas sacheonensis]
MQALDPESIQLIQLSVPNLCRLAVSERIELEALHIAEGALPPSKTVARALTQLDLGTPALWCIPFLIVSTSRSTLLGACGFKTAPVNGSVEISYGVARAERGHGIATMAVGKLQQLAARSDLVQQVVAHILPDNTASSNVVARLGFSPEGTLVDTDGELVMRWVWRVAS